MKHLKIYEEFNSNYEGEYFDDMSKEELSITKNDLIYQKAELSEEYKKLISSGVRDITTDRMKKNHTFAFDTGTKYSVGRNKVTGDIYVYYNIDSQFWTR